MEMGVQTVVGQVGVFTAQVPENAGVDLRKRRKEQVEMVLSRVEYLRADERSLLLAVLQNGQTAAQVALLTREKVRIVRRRVRLLTGRVLSAEFMHVVRRRQRWSRVRQQVGQMCFVEGKSLREVARVMSLSMYSVRRHCEWIRAGAAEASLEREHKLSA